MNEPTHEPASENPAEATDESTLPASGSRSQLVWEVLVFQLKLAVDGIKDLLLSPLSIIALIVGLVSGGREPDRQYRRLLYHGRRVEHWINLFGHRRGQTSDQLVEPLQRQVFAKFQRQPWLNRAGEQIGRTLDTVNDSIESRRRDRGPPP